MSTPHRVAKVELYHVSIPLPAAFRPAWIPGMPSHENRFTLVRITTEDGIEGYSAGPAIGRERAGLGDLLGPYLLGEDATDIDLVQQRLREIAYLGWRNWWIEPAFWDIKGKIVEKPVYELLGGEPGTIRLYASTGEVKDPAARIEEVEARYAEGFRTVKLRVHDLDEKVDIRHVTETAAAFGDRMKIGVDVNQGWNIGKLADLAPAFRDLDISMIEQPLPRGGDEELEGFESPVPLCADESCLNTDEFEQAARRYQVINIKLDKTGGLTEALDLALEHR